MAMRCYVIGYSVRLERALRGPLESSSHGGGRLLPRARVAGLSRVAVSKLVSKHRLSYYCDIYAPDVPVDGLFTATLTVIL